MSFFIFKCREGVFVAIFFFLVNVIKLTANCPCVVRLILSESEIETHHPLKKRRKKEKNGSACQKEFVTQSLFATKTVDLCE